MRRSPALDLSLSVDVVAAGIAVGLAAVARGIAAQSFSQLAAASVHNGKGDAGRWSGAGDAGVADPGVSDSGADDAGVAASGADADDAGDGDAEISADAVPGCP